MLNYSLIAFLLSMFIKRAGLALGLFLIYMLVENIVAGVLGNIYKLRAAEYLPEEVSDRLIPQPYFKMLVTRRSHRRRHGVQSRSPILPAGSRSVYADLLRSDGQMVPEDRPVNRCLNASSAASRRLRAFPHRPGASSCTEAPTLSPSLS